MLDNFEKKKRSKMTELWYKHFDEYKDGFELFTSELYEDAPALVIGFNPGGKLHTDEMTRSRMQQFTDGDYSRPPQVVNRGKHYHPCHLPNYASHSNQPSRIRKYLFEGKQDLLRRTVETNRFYMRTSGKGQHKDFLQGLSAEAFEDYMGFCRETTRETIRQTNPDVVIDVANQHYGRATEFCADVGFDSESKSYHPYENDESVKGSVSIAEMVEPPHAMVVSIRPHLSAPINQDILDLFREVVPPLLPDK